MEGMVAESRHCGSPVDHLDTLEAVEERVGNLGDSGSQVDSGDSAAIGRTA